MGPTRGASHGPAGQERERGAHAERLRDREHRRPEREAARGNSPAARRSPGRRGAQKSRRRPHGGSGIKTATSKRNRTQCARRGSSSFTGRPDTGEGPIASQGSRGRRRWSRGGRPRDTNESLPGGRLIQGHQRRGNHAEMERDVGGQEFRPGLQHCITAANVAELCVGIGVGNAL